ncbi:hypothetical protein C1H46_026435 [Malus baccata]|uniref:Dihydrodipicolinate reductase C-terminal domain-containing protein n=1 Tax=Malus baccata TaxID=106549 RepID=A0A540LP21_MALBA|nr:hypothetical protein C1H46_026435 [Malus baccata]
MEVAGSVDSYLVGEDIGKVCDMEEPLEIPITNDLTMATAFGMRSVVYVPKIKLDTVSALSALCDKASIGCLIAPTLSVGSILLQQAAISASFHYNNIEIVESRASATDFPSSDATQIANNLSNLGQIYNREDISTDVLARGQVLGDGVRVLSTTVHFSRLGEVYSLKHDITDVQCLMPGLLLAIRNIVRIKVERGHFTPPYIWTTYLTFLEKAWLPTKGRHEHHCRIFHGSPTHIITETTKPNYPNQNCNLQTFHPVFGKHGLRALGDWTRAFLVVA